MKFKLTGSGPMLFLATALILAVSYLATAGLVWVVMWELTAMGIVLPFMWSWYLSLVVWIIWAVLQSIFSKN